MKIGAKMDIAIAVPGLPFNGDTFDKISLGGSESAGYYLARALAALGHRVTVFCNTKPVSCKDVDYLPLGMFNQWATVTPHDVCIVQRTPDLFPLNCRAKLSILWCHDLALKRQELMVKGTSWNYSKLVVLSDFHRKQYKEVYDLPDDMLFLSRNGIDLTAIAKAKEVFPKDVVRNPLSIVFSARPERGLDVMLAEIMPRILKHEPKAKLFLSTYNNPNAEGLAEFYAFCKHLAAQLGDSVVFLGHLTKEKLYETYLACGLYCYPVPSRSNEGFDEISCISAMEAQGCGLPIVATARGALPETVAPGAGTLIDLPLFTPEFYDAFAEACLALMRDPAAHAAASQAGLERAATLDWSGIALEWSAMFEEEIRSNSSDLATMANHFWRHSDIYAAKECLAKLPEDDEKSRYVRERIATDFAFLEEPDGFRKQYERIGATHDERVIDWSNKEPRYAALRDWLSQRPEIIRVLDYGCAHGGYAINLLKDFPHLRITGVDIDLHGIELAYKFAGERGVADRFRGVVGDLDRLNDPNIPEMQEEYDAVLAQEVMEHVPDPSAMLAALEARVKDDGIVYITVPFGPWEFTDYARKWGTDKVKGYPHRAHLWEFDIHDLCDLLDFAKGKEAKVNKQALAFGNSPVTGEPLGWWIVSYRVTPETRGKVGKIDMERKLWLQRPRQTVSVGIMAGGEAVDETLHWCLRSLESVADEVVIVDCGISEEAKRILSLYDSRLRLLSDSGLDPKRDGFESPRNYALERATGDWFLWIDCDEKLLNAEHITKYLRPNCFNGYSIRQHHFACDTHFDADLPVRLFRNHKPGAKLRFGHKPMRFFGMIHEHPETGLNEGPGRTIVMSDIHIPHMGYLLEPGRQRKFDRNYPMLEADQVKYPERKLQKHFMMRDKMLIVGYRLRANGNRMLEEDRILCHEVQALWREHFRGKGFFTNSDPIDYYSEATALLGEGFSSAFQFEADKVDARPNGAKKVRFATVEDAEIEVSHRVRSAAQPFETRYW